MNITEYNKIYKYIDIYKLNIPIDLKIEDYYYHYNYSKNTNQEIVYRCKYPNKCKALISINIENIKKLTNPDLDQNTSIEYKKIKSNEHTCNLNKEITSKKNISKKDEDIKFLCEIINSNPFKLLTSLTESTP